MELPQPMKVPNKPYNTFEFVPRPEGYASLQELLDTERQLTQAAEDDYQQRLALYEMAERHNTLARVAPLLLPLLLTVANENTPIEFLDSADLHTLHEGELHVATYACIVVGQTHGLFVYQLKNTLRMMLGKFEPTKRMMLAESYDGGNTTTSVEIPTNPEAFGPTMIELAKWLTNESAKGLPL